MLFLHAARGLELHHAKIVTLVSTKPLDGKMGVLVRDVY